MSLFNGTELRELYLTVPSARSRWEALLDLSGLVAEELPDYAVGVFDADENLIGTASLQKNIIKYVAIHPEHRGEAIANTLISAIWNHASANGETELVVFTKPEYESLFTDLSFHPIGRSENAVMLESSPRALKTYLTSLEKEKNVHCKSGDKIGVIVMNTNPLTKGHLHLIRYSAANVDHLFIIPLADDALTTFSYESRRNALCHAAAKLTNVTVLEGSRYCISAATFPTYFIKERTRLTDTHIRVDLDIFLRHIAPALGATVRFVGEEPSDPLTARYNELMKSILPGRGVEVVEIPRLQDAAGKAISASAIRKGLQEASLYAVIDNVAEEALPAVLAKSACRALDMELELTPKPGLIDLNNSGSHTDMNYDTMRRSIKALEPVFEKLAAASMNGVMPDAGVLGPIGIDGERRMLQATGGINTHKGALFSLGLAVSAVAFILAEGTAEHLTPQIIGEKIAAIASTFNRPEDTNGAVVAKRYDVPTAIDTAMSGYYDALNRWIKIKDPLRRLTVIMSEMPDSNIYHRGGKNGAEFVMNRSQEILMTEEGDEDSLVRNLEMFDRECMTRNLSPGGCADMLALTFFIESVTGCNSEEIEFINNNNNLKN